MTFSELEKICEGTIVQLKENQPVENLIIDSRKALITHSSVFFALSGPRHNGHTYIRQLYELGMHQFVVEQDVDLPLFPLANFLKVGSSIEALQKIAIAHRNAFNIPVIGITGSNGKTIVKEWLYQLLSPDMSVVKNPGSYNSQVGVPLSVWAMQPHHEIGIFEAGISTEKEMEKLQAIIQPTIGIFTNIGSAHNEGFPSLEKKVEEKLKLFSAVNPIIYCSDYREIDEAVNRQHLKKISWAFSSEADIVIKKNQRQIEFDYAKKKFSLILPFEDKASVENAVHCVVCMAFLKYDSAVIQARISQLSAVPMRLELKSGVNGCQLIDDAYNNDMGGVRVSLDFLANQQKSKRSIIISDLLQTGQSPDMWVNELAGLIKNYPLQRVICIGPMLKKFATSFAAIPHVTFYESTDEFLAAFNIQSLENEMILVKGARAFQFEKIIHRLQRKVHGTVMEIDLNKMVHNLNFFKSKLKPGVKLMAMVKAFAYGSGSEEVANLLQYHHVDYLGVAYADEGIELRKKNISLPIMVMNSSEESFAMMREFKLEPVVYNLKILKSLLSFLKGGPFIIHLEFETGMHRLGLEGDELSEAVKLLKENPQVKIASVFSHLAGADEKLHDDFSKSQFEKFNQAYQFVSDTLSQKPLRHILNSPGILRLKDYQLDMVRLGIGLYGVNPTSEDFSALQPVATLKTVISQIKKIEPDETVGYGRHGKSKPAMTIATLAIGYADGFSRSFSKGKGHVLINGKRAPVIGNVCMDMTMVDITEIEAHEGDEAIIFGNDLPISEVAASIGTIPYEILTNTSERVKRVFFAEGI
jgi:alanine racemase